MPFRETAPVDGHSLASTMPICTTKAVAKVRSRVSFNCPLKAKLNDWLIVA